MVSELVLREVLRLVVDTDTDRVTVPVKQFRPATVIVEVAVDD